MTIQPIQPIYPKPEVPINLDVLRDKVLESQKEEQKTSLSTAETFKVANDVQEGKIEAYKAGAVDIESGNTDNYIKELNKLEDYQTLQKTVKAQQAYGASALSN